MTWWKKDKCCNEVVQLLKQIADTEEQILQTDQKILVALNQPQKKAVALRFTLGKPQAE